MTKAQHEGNNLSTANDVNASALTKDNGILYTLSGVSERDVMFDIQVGIDLKAVYSKGIEKYRANWPCI